MLINPYALAVAGGGGGGGWTPADIDARMWLDFSDGATIGVTGTAINSVADKSSYGNDLANVYAGRNPTLVAAAINGLSVARFGTNQLLMVTSPTSFFGVSANMAYVLHRPSNAADTRFFGTNASTPWWMRPISGGSSTAQVNSSSVLGGSSWNMRFNGGAAQGSETVTNDDLNDVLAAGAACLVSHENLNLSAFNWGSRFGIGSNTGYFGLQGDFCELVVFPASTSDREKAEGYLAHKWGIAGSLPGGHPYKAAPPPAP